MDRFGAGLRGFGYGVSVRVGAFPGGATTGPEYGALGPGVGDPGAEVCGVIVEVGTRDEGMVVGNSVVAHPGRSGSRDIGGATVSTGVCSVVTCGTAVDGAAGTDEAVGRADGVGDTEVADARSTAGSPTRDDVGPVGVNTCGDEFPVRAAPTA